MILKNEDFPFDNVSFYLKYLIHLGIVNLFDERIEHYNKLLIEFSEKCASHERTMKVINYTVKNFDDKNIIDLYSYLKKSLIENLKKYLKSKNFVYISDDEGLPF